MTNSLERAIQERGLTPLGNGHYAVYNQQDQRWQIGDLILDEECSEIRWAYPRWAPKWWTPEQQFATRCDLSGALSCPPETHCTSTHYRVTANLETGEEIRA